MNHLKRTGAVLVFSSCLVITGCQKTAQDQAATQTLSSDPANGNLAPGDQSAPVQRAQAASRQYPVSPAPPTTYSRAPLPEPSPQVADNYHASETYDTPDNGPSGAQYESADYGQQAVYAPQPPPPLPEYSQPECPGENYIWTPGSWGYASAGYYWIPGVWVMAPYVHALWTPPYWESYEGRYRWHHGYWGQHIGFYGGIQYGFGYTGRGYSGGYWSGDRFNYNRSVNNVNVSRVTNVYNYTVVNNNLSRVSFNGGRGGIEARPTSPEIAVLREQRVAPVPAQVEHMRQAAAERSQFVSVNQGRPAAVVAARPLQTEYRSPAQAPPPVQVLRAPVPMPVQPVPAARGREQFERTQNQTTLAPVFRPAPENRPVPLQQPVPAIRQIPETRPVPQQQPAPVFRPAPENRPVPQQQPAPVFRPAPENRPMPQQQPERVFRPAPEAQPQPQLQQRPAPVEPMRNERARPETRPAPMPEQRTAPQARPEPPHQAAPPPQPQRQEARPVPQAPHEDKREKK